MVTKKIDLWVHQEDWVVGQALQILEAYDRAVGPSCVSLRPGNYVVPKTAYI